MSLPTEDIERALIGEVATSLGSSWDIKKPLISFKPSVNRPYARGTTLWMRPERVAIGNGGYYRTNGTYQVDLFWPAAGTLGQQSRDALRARDALAVYFFPSHNLGRVITAGSTSIIVDREPGPGPVFEDDPAHIQLVLEIYFYVDTPPA